MIPCGCFFKDNSKNVINQNANDSVEKDESSTIENQNADTDSTKISNENAKSSTADESLETTQEDTQMLEEKISVDCIFSLGIACKPSGHLRDLNMRFQAAPLDWMMCYSLDTAAHLFETKFVDFFDEIEDVSGKSTSSYRCVRDKKNNIDCIHHFKKSNSLKKEQENFRETMLKRAQKVDEILKKASSIALICDRKGEKSENLINFLERFSKVYPNKKVTLININDANIKGINKEILFENGNLKIIQYTFNDKSNSKYRSEAWKGNQEIWKSIIKSLNLTNKFYNSETCQKVEF